MNRLKLHRLALRLTQDTGFSLVETMVTVGMVGIVALGSLSIQKMNMDAQRQNQVVNTAQSLKTRLENLLRNQNSWQATLENNPALDCLFNQTSCVALRGVDTDFNVYEVGGGLAFSSLGTSTNGFRENGTPCDSYDADGGPCAFGYNITLRPVGCSGNCINPAVEITATLNYSPSISTVPLATSKYSIGGVPPFIRTATSMNMSFFLSAEDRTDPFTSGGGACCDTPPCTGSNYTVTRSYTLITDPRDIISNLNPGNTSNSFSINQAGSYRCTGTAAGFGVNTFRVNLVTTDGTQLASVSGFAPKSPVLLQNYVNFEALFTIENVPTTIQIQQSCSSAPNSIYTDEFALGLPASPYDKPSSFASLMCVLVEASY